MALDDDERDEDDDVVHGHDPDDPPDESGDWERIPLSATSTQTEIDAVIRHYVEWTLADLREQLVADEEVTAAQREYLLRRARVFVEATTRETIEAGQTRRQRPQ